MVPALNAKPPPLTAAERKKRSRAKKKATDPNYQINENRRIEELRKRKVESMNTQQLKAYRMTTNQRKKRSRSLLKEQAMQSDLESSRCDTPENSYKPYKKPQSLGKAIRKSMRSLPSSPRKKLAVVTGIAKCIRLNFDEELHPSNQSLSAETKELVEQFYFRSDIVYTDPSMKGVVTVWRNGKKETLRRYYLTMYLKEAFALVEISHPNTAIGLPTFCALRPPNVLLMKDTPADQCLCIIHENFFLKLKALKIFYNRDWWRTVLCNDKDLTSPCWMGNCLDCQNGKKLAVEMDPATIVYWYEWIKEKRIEGEIEKKHIQKILKKGCASQLHEILLQSIPVVQEHTRVKRIQAEEFQSDQNDLSKRILQIDFSMSYSCEYQNEIQSALWSRQSVTLFNAAVLHGKSCSTYLICSDTKKKDKDTVAVFLNILYEAILKEENVNCTNSTIATEVIWSDGPSSEFKNQFMLKLLQQLSRKFTRPFHWKYFATSHGKGIVDGIGGNVKSLVRAEVMSKKRKSTVIQSSLEFANVASSLMKKTEVIHVSEAEIQERITEMNPWENSLPVLGIRKIHFITCDCDGNIQLFNTSKAGKCSENAGPSGILAYGLASDNEDDAPAHPVSESKNTVESEEYCIPKQGSFILVDYSTKKTKKVFLGQLVQSDPQKLEHEVSFLQAVDDKKRVFRFPSNEDVAWISDDQIIRVNCPKLTHFARELYTFESKVNVFE